MINLFCALLIAGIRNRVRGLSFNLTVLLFILFLANFRQAGFSQDGKAVSIDPRRAAARATLLSYEGQKLMAERNYDAACRKFEEATRVQEKNKELQKQYALCLDTYGVELYKTRNFKAATEKIQLALRLSPENEQYKSHLARVKQALKDAEQKPAVQK